jgi:hypothetical protein
VHPVADAHYEGDGILVVMAISSNGSCASVQKQAYGFHPACLWMHITIGEMAQGTLSARSAIFRIKPGKINLWAG